jgi:hypothetical protein
MVNITYNTDPAWGTHHATVHDDAGETIARFYGGACAQNAQAFVAGLRAEVACAWLSAETAWRIDANPGRLTLTVWRSGKPYEATTDIPEFIPAVTDLVARVIRLIENHQATVRVVTAHPEHEHVVEVKP